MKKQKPFYVFKFWLVGNGGIPSTPEYRLYPYDPREVYGEDINELTNEVLGGCYSEGTRSIHCKYVPRPSKAILETLLDDAKVDVKDAQRNIKVKKELVIALTEQLNKE